VTQLDFSPDLAAAAQRLARAFTPSLGWRDAIDGLRNAALFGGLGVVWVVTSPSGKVRAEIWRATLVALGLSVTVEGLQVFSPVRTASIVDVTTNALGALGGAVVMALLVTAVVRAKGGHFLLGVPTFLLAGAYALAALCEAVTPLFRSDRLPGVEGGPLTLLHTMLDQSAPLRLGEVPLLDVPLFAPAGFLVVVLLFEGLGSARRIWPAVAGAGAGLAFAAELLHGAFGLSIRWEAAATHAAAVGAGAWAAQHRLPELRQGLRGWARARAAIAAYAGLLVLWGWRPFLPRTDIGAITQQLTTDHLVPLASLAGRVDVFSALHVAQQFLLYLPLGSLARRVAAAPLAAPLAGGMARAGDRGGTHRDRRSLLRRDQRAGGVRRAGNRVARRAALRIRAARRGVSRRPPAVTAVGGPLELVRAAARVPVHGGGGVHRQLLPRPLGPSRIRLSREQSVLYQL